MTRLKAMIVLGILAAILGACNGEAGPQGPEGAVGPIGPQGPAGPAATLDVANLSCTECHNDTTLIFSKQAQFRESLHGTGEAFVRGGSDNCAGCHGSEGPTARIAAGLAPHDEAVVGITNVSPYNCRTCHSIHTTYTEDDFVLVGESAPAVMEMTTGTFDLGPANLCAECHQIRNELPEIVDGQVEITSTRFGTHHGVEAQMLLGEGGMLVEPNMAEHYEDVEDGCITCHMGEDRSHSFEPQVSYCIECHDSIETLDYHDVQTEIAEQLAELRPLLIAAGIMDEERSGEDGWRTFEGVFPESVAAAMWNTVFVAEDQSMGVHNTGYARDLLEQAKAALEEYLATQ